MMNVVITLDVSRFREYVRSRLTPIVIAYYDPDSATPVCESRAFVPKGTDMRALEHMLELWSLEGNAHEQR